MPQQSYQYACARVSALSKRILSPSAIRRMAEGSLDDALRTLADVRYGGMSDAADTDVEKLIEKELKGAAEELDSLTPEQEVSNLFLLQNDMQNLKMLIKARLLGTSETRLASGGVYTKEQLGLCVRDRNYGLLPELLKESLTALEKQLDAKPSPQLISISIDKAYSEYVKSVAVKSKFAARYFAVKADFDNVLTFLRMRAMGSDRDSLARALLAEGGIKHKQLLAAYELSEESVERFLDESVCRAELLSGLNAMHKSGSMGAVEKARDDCLLAMVSERRGDCDSFYPIIGYYLAKQREAQAVRLIITAKRNGLADSVISERLVKMYG
ncbi:MAG TPA: V-type ATPase subunit [Eubacteriales bacterium]|nr:V-type ATPase subunit [Eubacteriales bacterium]